jgi:ABC-2 type transport system permease protein
MDANNTLQPIPAHGWRAGLGNLWWKEMHDWWGTRTWIVQLLIWLAILNGFVFLVLVMPAPDITSVTTSDGETIERRLTEKDRSALSVFFLAGGYALTIGVTILAQDKIIGEKRTGTAAWILSKPVSRPAFVLARLSGLLLNLLILGVVLQGMITYAMVCVYRGGLVPPLPFLAGMGMLAECILFYLSLSIMLGTLSDRRGVAMGIPLVLILGDSIFPQILPFLSAIMPWSLPQASSALVSGMQVPRTILVPVILTLLWSAIFIAVALRRFQREEF